MRIIVLDGYTLNPGDISWQGLEELGELTVYDRTPAEEIFFRSREAEIILTNKTPLGSDMLNRLDRLRYIGVLATGYNVIDIEIARKRGIVVTNIPAYGTASVAQMTFALLLELCLHVQKHSDSVMSGKWANSKDFCFSEYPLIELAGKTIGIIGFGNIGQKVADIATAFDMEVLGYDLSQTNQSHRKNFTWCGISDLLNHSEIISIHCPLTIDTEGLINKSTIKKMKNATLLINTSRGPIIVEKDLADALNNGEILGAGLDVLSIEPPLPDNPLFTARNCIITPHIAWATREARSRCMNIAVTNIKSFLSGMSSNVVNN
jgi:glycerate dehydrogenase